LDTLQEKILKDVSFFNDVVRLKLKANSTKTLGDSGAYALARQRSNGSDIKHGRASAFRYFLSTTMVFAVTRTHFPKKNTRVFVNPAVINKQLFKCYSGFQMSLLKPKPR